MIYLVLDIVTTAAILFIIASGLLIIFGVMKIINFSHASFLTVGAYASLVATWLGWNPWLSLPLAFVSGGVLGAIIEVTILRYLYHRPLDAILATWGLGIMIGQLITMIFGREVQFAARPISGAIEIFGANYSLYRLLLILFAVLVAAAMALLMNGTRVGLQTRAVIANEPLSRSLGISSARVRLLTFAFGSGLACLAGAFITPLSSVDPNMGVPWLVAAFMLVLVSGNSYVSLAIACVFLGGIQVLVSTFVSPVLGGLTLAVMAVLLLRISPKGFAYD
ncbi:ABC transporter permease subunit [Pikeienuella sp. HZG-20]|uniref:branched-chain amino acid ABC transporter permease n=1 Tax=Paludibacillus litoralis TaxID=3133267 RepID=UPI0030EBD191